MKLFGVLSCLQICWAQLGRKKSTTKDKNKKKKIVDSIFNPSLQQKKDLFGQSIFAIGSYQKKIRRFIYLFFSQHFFILFRIIYSIKTCFINNNFQTNKQAKKNLPHTLHLPLATENHLLPQKIKTKKKISWTLFSILHSSKKRICLGNLFLQLAHTRKKSGDLFIYFFRNIFLFFLELFTV